MKQFAILSTSLGVVFALAFPAPPVEATPPSKVYVSSNGVDNGTCGNISAPCNSFQQAHDNVAVGGEVSVLTSGDYGPVNVTKGVHFTNDGSTEATIQVGVGGAGISINAGQFDVVSVRGLIIQGGISGASAIRYVTGHALHIHNCVVRNFIGPGTWAISIVHTASGQLFVTDTMIYHGTNGSGNPDNGAILIQQPSGASGSVRAALTHVRVEGHNVGIVIDGTNSSGRTVVEINDSVVTGNIYNGITVINAGALINRTSVEGNGGNGVLAGPSSLIHLGSSTVATNALGGLAYNGGQILSYQDNKVLGNGVDNNPSGVLALK